MGNYIDMMGQNPMVNVEGYQLYYDEARNIMMDEGGFPVFNIFEHISPAMYYLFRENKEYMIIRSKLGPLVELIWPEHDDEELNLERSFDYE
jgi:hypothetical protein